MHLGCGCDQSCNDAETCFCVAQYGCFYDEEGKLKELHGMTNLLRLQISFYSRFGWKF